MNISRRQFQILSLNQQISVLETLGVFLACRKSGKYTMLLYGMSESYYVEVIQTEPGFICSVEFISDDAAIELYLHDLSVENVFAG